MDPAPAGAPGRARSVAPLSVLVARARSEPALAIDPRDSRRRLEASGLPTGTVGFGLPLMNYSSDVLVRRDGTIVVSGDADGSLLELTPR